MKKHWIYLACFLAITATMPLRSQTDGENLVFNPSFEEHRKCPMKIDALGVMTEADAWWQPTSGSSDYFNACGSRECNVPRNKMGFQKAHDGNAYCGIYCSQELYREYLQTELKEPLVAGKRYRVSFWVSLADKSPFAVATLGAMLTPQRLEDSTHGILMEREMTTLDGSNTQSIATHFEPQVLNSMDNILDNTKEWVEVSGEFIANGGERFLTIGNFLPFNKSSVVGMEGANLPVSGAYYYIDDVSVVRLDTEKPIIPQTSKTPKAGEVITLKNLYFATDKSEVLQQSYNELFQLKEMLEQHPSIKIELRGHTDNQGTVDHNQKLSEARAKAVADYLIGKGIDKRRLTWIGFGKSQPVADNATAEGRSKNRRVEYRIIAD